MFLSSHTLSPAPRCGIAIHVRVYINKILEDPPPLGGGSASRIRDRVQNWGVGVPPELGIGVKKKCTFSFSVFFTIGSQNGDFGVITPRNCSEFRCVSFLI